MTIIDVPEGSLITPLRQPWHRLITVGRAYELLRTDLRRHLERAQREIGWDYCRFHALFHDDMAVVKDDQGGEKRYQWHNIEEIYDTLLDLGLRPFVELNSMPKALASGDRTIFWYAMNVTPPRSYSEWEDLIEHYARRCVQRYGRREVRQWYFELWNEPNLPGFWTGDFEAYVRLYQYTVKALRRVDRELRVGGPATAGAAWIHEFLSACKKHDLPVDFVSTHRYPQDAFTAIGGEQQDGIDIDCFFDDSFQTVQQQVLASAYPHVEIHWTEWNSQAATSAQGVTWGNNRYVESSYAASFITRHCIELDTTCDSMGWWALSDIFEEAGPQLHPFNCGYGLLTVDGLPKAAYNAFRFLDAMQGNRLHAPRRGDLPAGCGYEVSQEDGCLRVLLWHHAALQQANASPWKPTVQLPLMDGILTSQRIAPGKGSPVETWQAIGCPHQLNPQTYALLEAASRPEVCLLQGHATSGVIATTVELPPFTVLLLEWSQKTGTAQGKGMEAYGTASPSDIDDLETLLSGEDL